MAHKVYPCNQRSPSLGELSFSEQMQPAQERELDSATDKLNTALPKAVTNFVKEKQNDEYTASRKSPISRETHARLSDVKESGFEFSEKLNEAWRALNHDQRELLWLYVVEGLASAQIAERKQQSHSSIRQALSNAYAQLLLQVDCT